MKTIYYCIQCDESFVREELPNFNRMHDCGKVARIVEHAAYGEPEAAESETSEGAG